jgi:hypothetical protein
VQEIWQQAILPYNLPFTILLGLVVLFWLFTIVGAVGVDSLDIDLDADSDGDLSHFGDVPGALLRVVNAGSVPVTIVLSVLVVSLWVGMMVLNHYFNPGQSVWLGVGFFVVAFVGGVLVTKAITQPLVPFMKKLKQAEDAAPVIGCVGVVRSIQIDSEYGQVEVERPDGAPALLNARLGPDAQPAARGSEVAIVAIDESTGVYLARVIPPAPSTD